MVLGKNKKENVIGFRINNNQFNILERITTKVGLKKSEFVRKAVNTQLYIATSNIPIILWGRNEFAFTFKCMNDSQIKELADLSYKNGIEATNYLFGLLQDEIEYGDGVLDLTNIPVQILLKSLIDRTLSPELMNFFDSIEWSWIEKPRKRLRIIGNHSINENFSKYVKNLMENYLINLNYKLTKEVLLEDMMLIEFTKIKKNKSKTI